VLLKLRVRNWQKFGRLTLCDARQITETERFWPFRTSATRSASRATLCGLLDCLGTQKILRTRPTDGRLGRASAIAIADRFVLRGTTNEREGEKDSKQSSERHVLISLMR
jgi:hypothetical protein